MTDRLNVRPETPEEIVIRKAVEAQTIGKLAQRMYSAVRDMLDTPGVLLPPSFILKWHEIEQDIKRQSSGQAE